MSILSAIGNTPLVDITNLNGHSGVRILAKLEGNNPGGSVKDRPAYYMIKKAEESGALTRDKTILRADLGKYGYRHCHDRSRKRVPGKAGHALLCEPRKTIYA